MAFNYLGPNMGPSTVANTLPSGVPGTVPAAIPGATTPNAVGSVSPTGSVIPSRPVIPSGPLPPALQQAIQAGGPAGPGAMQPPPPEPGHPDADYETLTQQDGTIVIFLKNPDGTRGPAVKIIKMGGKIGKPS